MEGREGGRERGMGEGRERGKEEEDVLGVLGSKMLWMWLPAIKLLTLYIFA